MSKQENWILSDEFLIDSAEKRMSSGDHMGALTVLNKRAGLYPPSADSLALYADVYEELELWHLAADAWFHFLDICNEADFSEGYEGLAIAFLNMGNELQSTYYYTRAYADEEGFQEGFADFLENYSPDEPPALRIVGEEDPEALREGLGLMREGELQKARQRLFRVDPESPDFPAAAALAAMCLLMMGDEGEAEAECKELVSAFPENTNVLTTYIAVLGARGKKKRAAEIARKLAGLHVEGTDELFRIATALCETGLDEEAFRVLTELRVRLPYDENVLYFYAVAAHHLGRTDEAISSLEMLTTVYPRKAIARYYLEHLRLFRDGEGKSPQMSFFYRLPQSVYTDVADILLSALRWGEEQLGEEDRARIDDCISYAFDELEGRDEKLQVVAVKLAARTRRDEFLREKLLDFEGSDLVKFAILHEFTVRNEENSFGTVFLNLYREFFTHTIDIGTRKATEFLDAFADVYSKYGLLGPDDEGKLCGAAEDIYAALEEANAWRFIDDRSALSAAIYRESRLGGQPQTLKDICDMFDADRYVTQEILDFLM